MPAQSSASTSDVPTVDPQSDAAALWLCQLPGITAALVRALLARFGSAAGIVEASSGALREAGLPPALVARMVAGRREVPQVAAGLRGWQRLGIAPLPLAAPRYPQRLLQLAAPPLVVYIQGAWPMAEPLACVVLPHEVDATAHAAWLDLVHALAGKVRWAANAAPVAPGVQPRLLGLSYGLMLARQRIAPALWNEVAAGELTLLSVAPPAAPPRHDDLGESATLSVLAALSDALVFADETTAGPGDLVGDAADAAARALNVARFAALGRSQTELRAGVRRLRPGKTAPVALLKALGVHGSAGTIQQERLF